MPLLLAIELNLIIFLFGIVIGSFLNVCIYRIPKKESIVVVRSHCMSCGYQLKWYDLFPLFSYIFLGGKCRKCKAKISIQYPIIEALNGVFYLIIFMINGINVDSLLYCLLFSTLIVLSVIDFRTYEIPVGLNITILALGLIRVAVHYQDWLNHVIGLFAVSVLLWIIYQVSKGRAIGGGDVKLMAAAGLFLGWKNIIFAFCVGCILGAVIHVARMKLSERKGQEANHVLAMGPYLAAGIAIATLFGDSFISWYIALCGF